MPRFEYVSTIGLAALLLTSFAMREPQEKPKEFATDGYPAEQISAAVLTENRCAKCHSMARVLKASYGVGEWADVVTEMAAKEKSGISPKDAKTITAFLDYRAAHPIGRSEATPREKPTTAPAAIGDRPARAFYSPRSFAKVATAEITSRQALPATITLGSRTFVVRAIARDAKLPGRYVATIEFNGDVQTIAWGGTSVPDPADRLDLRRWEIGTRAFTESLVIYDVDARGASSERPTVVFATLVVRL